MTTKRTTTKNATRRLTQKSTIEMIARLAEIERIARKELGLETLDARNSDRLDFHELAVWQIRRAMLRAYEAGLARR